MPWDSKAWENFDMSKTPRTKVRSVFLIISKMLRIFDDHRKSLISEMLGNRLFTSGESPGIAHGDFRHFDGNSSVKTAIEAGDYSAFISAINSGTGRYRNLNISEDKFNNLVLRQKIEQAIQKNDYNAWKIAKSDLIENEKAQITQENFDKIVQMRQQFQNKNRTAMKHMKGFGKGRFSH